MKLLILCLVVFLRTCLAFEQQFDLTMPETPDNSTQSIYNQLSSDSLFWGPYRSGNYLGIKPRLPFSLTLGLLWFNADTQMGFSTLKHKYEQGHNVGKANWVEFDPRMGGKQFISDNDCHVDITIHFVKSENGRNWGVKVKAVPHKGFESVKTSMVWYSGLEGLMIDENSGETVPNGFIKLDNALSKRGYKGTVELLGFSQDLGTFDLKINDGGPNVRNKHPRVAKLPIPELNPRFTHHMSLRVPDGNVWRGEEIFVTLLQESIQDFSEKLGDGIRDMDPALGFLIRDLSGYEGNFHIVQKMYEGAFEFDVVYIDQKSPPTEHVTFENINQLIEATHSKFELNFAKHFPLRGATKSEKKFGKELLSGLLGGLSYFHGDHKVDRTLLADDEELAVDVNGEVHLPKFKGKFEGPFELFTLVPSRPFFPRGFYWDEGFHLLPLLEYDTDLALEIIQSWFNLIDDGGWIAREQILGPEARLRVPAEFVDQSSAIVNPPTIMLAFTYLLEKAQQNALGDVLDKPVDVDFVPGEISRDQLGHIVVGNPDLLANYTREIYPKLKLHFESFRQSQRGMVEEFDRGENHELFRWRGRTTTHCLALGLDDYPRVLPIDPAELNVDLLCWIGVMTRSIKRIAELLEIQGDVAHYSKIEQDIAENIEKFHWSEENKCYCDVSVDEDDETVMACYKGYISLFPFLTKFIPAHDVAKIESIVDLLSDPRELWTDFGIRSISKSSEFYRTGENYWRSPIWMNINYLVLENLKFYFDASKEYSSPELKEKINTTYSQLRKNIIFNVKKEWSRTGYVWENYDDITGHAKGAKNFLGWSSLVLLMMEMPKSLK